jgi:membrane protein
MPFTFNSPYTFAKNLIRNNKNMKRGLKLSWDFISDVFNSWSDDNCFRLSAALSYYTLFSIAPLVVVVIATAGYFFGEQAITGVIFNKVNNIIGAQAASGLQTMVKNAYISKPNSLSGLVSVGVLVFSATVVLTALQGSLNTIWNVRIRADKGIIYFVISRLLALLMLLVIGVLLVATIIINTVWVAIGDYLQQYIADYAIYLIETGQLIISLGTTTVLFALLFKYLPDAKIKWSNVWIGAMTTSILFLIGRYFISFYLGSTNITTLYGAAGSVILLIVWINYSSWIFFLGAEVVNVVGLRKGEKVIPSKIAEVYREIVE